MFSSSISQFCQKIPFCEGAKTVLTENPKAALFTAIGVVGITLIAQRVFRATPSPDGGAPAEHGLLPRSESVIFHPAGAPPPTRPSMAADPDEEPTGTVLVDGHPFPTAGSSEEARMSAIIHIPSDDEPVASEPSDSPVATEGKYGKHKIRKRPPPVPPKKKEGLPRARFSTELIEGEAGRAGKCGLLVKSNAIMDLSFGNPTIHVRFFQNSYFSEIKIDGYKFWSARVAILAMLFPNNKKDFEPYDSNGAIKLAELNKHLIREDWAEVQDREMHRVLWAKFSQNEDFKNKLLATGNAPLTYVFSEKEGFQDDEDRNKGGIALMKIRGELGGTGIVERGEIPSPPEVTPPPPAALKPILNPPGANPSRVRRAVRWFLPKNK